MPDPPADHNCELAPGVRVPGGAVSFTFSRGGGPGGQNVNKVNTHATLTLPLDALQATMPDWSLQRLRVLGRRYLAQSPERLVIHAADSRSQLANRRACLAKLRHLLISARDRPRPRRPTRPSPPRQTTPDRRQETPRPPQTATRTAERVASQAVDQQPPTFVEEAASSRSELGEGPDPVTKN